MRIVFGNWKYIIKNFVFLFPFAILPAVFLTLSMDGGAIRKFVFALFDGTPNVGFVNTFSAFSILRVDSWLGLVYDVLAILTTSVCAALMLSLVEKHMRIGKRSLSGAFSLIGGNLAFAFALTLLYTALYEVYSLLTAAALYCIGNLVKIAAVAYVLDFLAFALLTGVLLYCATIFFLWFPCRQLTGFSSYESLRYAYQLMLNVRGRLFLAFLLSFACSVAVVGAAAALLHPYWCAAVGFVIFYFLFLSFCIRMETVYFAADRLDREDLIRSYLEL